MDRKAHPAARPRFTFHSRRVVWLWVLGRSVWPKKAKLSLGHPFALPSGGLLASMKSIRRSSRCFDGRRANSRLLADRLALLLRAACEPLKRPIAVQARPTDREGGVVVIDAKRLNSIEVACSRTKWRIRRRAPRLNGVRTPQRAHPHVHPHGLARASKPLLQCAGQYAVKSTM